jgi:hypothetical protein
VSNLGGNAQRTRHMFNKAFLEALADHFRREGAKVIERVAKNQPAAYLKICALLVPKYFKVEGTDGAKGGQPMPWQCQPDERK